MAKYNDLDMSNWKEYHDIYTDTLWMFDKRDNSGAHNVCYHRTCFKYNSGNKEAWQCKKYKQGGKKGCDSITIYTSELDLIVKEIINNLKQYDNKSTIDNLMKIYSNQNVETNTDNEIFKINQQIENIIKRKDKLLDLSIDGNLSNNEFSIRNNQFNQDINLLEQKLLKIKEDKAKNQNIKLSLTTFQEIIHQKLDNNNFNFETIDSIIDKIEVYKTKDNNTVALKIYLKIINIVIEHQLNRC